MTHQMCFFPKHKPDHATPLLKTLQCLLVVYRTKFRCLSMTLEGLHSDPAFLPFPFPFIVPTEPKNQSHEIMLSWAFANLCSDVLLPLFSIWGPPTYPARPTSNVTSCETPLIPAGRVGSPVKHSSTSFRIYLLRMIAGAPSRTLAPDKGPGR